MFDVSTLSKEQIFVELSAQLPVETVLRHDEPLAKKTTLRVGGSADIYVEPISENGLSRVIQFCGTHEVPFMILGRGSNLLIRDGGIRGVVVCLSHPSFSKIEIDNNLMRCGAGAKLKNISVEARRNLLSGLEFLEGIPGSLGGALRMNAGAMGKATFDVVEKIRFMDFAGEIHERPVAEVSATYRCCPLFKNHIALGAVLCGEASSKEFIAERMDAFSQKRWASQPKEPSAGCIFKNPESIGAGKLIDELGLKGMKVGGAVVSDVHGNFIVNDGTATGRDVLDLIESVKARVREAWGIELHTEVEIIGEEKLTTDEHG